MLRMYSRGKCVCGLCSQGILRMYCVLRGGVFVNHLSHGY